jgi:predicted transcriptional regulator
MFHAVVHTASEYPRLMASRTEGNVSEVMLRHPKTLPADVTVAEARSALENAKTKMLLLVDGSRFSGAITAIPEDADLDAPAIGFADESPPTANADMPVSEALVHLGGKPNGRLIVLDGADLAGLVCLTSDGTDFCGT